MVKKLPKCELSTENFGNFWLKKPGKNFLSTSREMSSFMEKKNSFQFWFKIELGQLYLQKVEKCGCFIDCKRATLDIKTIGVV